MPQAAPTRDPKDQKLLEETLTTASKYTIIELANGRYGITTSDDLVKRCRKLWYKDDNIKSNCDEHAVNNALKTKDWKTEYSTRKNVRGGGVANVDLMDNFQLDYESDIEEITCLNPPSGEAPSHSEQYWIFDLDKERHAFPSG